MRNRVPALTAFNRLEILMLRQHALAGRQILEFFQVFRRLCSCLCCGQPLFPTTYSELVVDDDHLPMQRYRLQRNPQSGLPYSGH
jgi:hypothetical protein